MHAHRMVPSSCCKLKSRMRLRGTFALCALAAQTSLFAQTKSPTDDAVGVTTLRNPVDKSYRRMVEGMELFEKRHRLAPNAALRFKLLPRHRDSDMRDIHVEI